MTALLVPVALVAGFCTGWFLRYSPFREGILWGSKCARDLNDALLRKTPKGPRG